MIKAILKKTGITVYIHEGKKPNMPYNTGMFVVSKQLNSPYIFCAAPEELVIIDGGK